MTRPKESEREDIRQLVLDKSRELFSKHGFENVTMRRIADEIGYSAAAIYLYFKSKDEVIFQIYNAGFKMLYDRQIRIVEARYDDPLQKMEAHGREYMRFATEYPEYYDLMFIAKGPPEFMQHCHDAGESQTDFGMRSFDVLRHNVRECIEAGYFKGSDVDTVAFLMWSLVHGMISLILRKRVPVTETVQQQLLHSAMNSLYTLIKK